MNPDAGRATSTSERVRRHRDRRRRGARIFALELTDSHIEHLVRTRRLSPQSRDDIDSVLNACQAFVEEAFQRDRLNVNPWRFSLELQRTAIEHMISRGWLAASARFEPDSVQRAFRHLVLDALSRE